MRQLGCVTCHQTDHAGPTAPVAETAPTIDEAGAKLTSSWLAAMLDGSAANHHRGQLRMPRYDTAVAKPLVVALAKASGLAPETATDTSSVEATLSAEAALGVGLLGTNAAPRRHGLRRLSRFSRARSIGRRRPDLTHAGRRLRADWFRRWMRDPAPAFSPAPRCPTISLRPGPPKLGKPSARCGRRCRMATRCLYPRGSPARPLRTESPVSAGPQSRAHRHSLVHGPKPPRPRSPSGCPGGCLLLLRCRGKPPALRLAGGFLDTTGPSPKARSRDPTHAHSRPVWRTLPTSSTAP